MIVKVQSRHLTGCEVGSYMSRFHPELHKHPEPAHHLWIKSRSNQLTDSSWIVITPSANKSWPAKWPCSLTRPVAAGESVASNTALILSAQVVTRILALLCNKRLLKMACARSSPYSSLSLDTSQTGRISNESRLFFAFDAVNIWPAFLRYDEGRRPIFSLPFYGLWLALPLH